MGFIINPYLVQPSVPAFTGLLDTYSGAAAAYSAARRLSSTYTGSLIRVRRSSDNTEQDIGYDSNNVLDESALTTFVGANSAYITIWYDQSGNGNNATQTTAVNQPRIVNAGTIDKINGKPSMLFDGTNDGFNLTSSITGNQPKSEFLVQQMNSQVSFMGLCGPASGGGNTLYGPAMFPKYSLTLYMRWQQGYLTKTSENITTQTIMTGIGLSSSGKYYRNNSLQSTTYTAATLTNDYTQLGYGNDYSNGYAQECVHYSSDQDSNVSGINSNMNAFYSVY